jgi:hypothetical protein
MNSATRTFALSLAILAMVLRGLLPVGWMPDSDGSGRIVICTGHGPARSAPDPQRGHTLPDRGDKVCPFAAAAHHSPPLALAVAPVPFVNDLRVARVATAQRLSERRLDASHSPRAPPTLA